MKLITASLILLSVIYVWTCSPVHSASGYHWVRAVNPGVKMWIFGGMGATKATNEVWTSTDGVTWSQIERAPWFQRGAKYSAVFNENLWIYGGKTGTTYEQADDVWFMKTRI